MNTSIRPCTTALAAIGASIIALSVVSAPTEVSNAETTVTRPVEVHAVQLAAATTATVLREAVAPSAIDETAAPTIGGTVRSIEVAAPGVAIAAVWYLAAPVTFPLTVAAIYLLSQINFPQTIQRWPPMWRLSLGFRSARFRTRAEQCGRQCDESSGQSGDQHGGGFRTQGSGRQLALAAAFIAGCAIGMFLMI
jgi:hypothetical protein